MKTYLILILVSFSLTCNGQKMNKKQKISEPDSSCIKLLVAAKSSYVDGNLGKARDYCEAGLLICGELSDTLLVVLKSVNKAIDDQKLQAQELRDKMRQARDSVQVLNRSNLKIIDAFYFYNNQFALAFKSGRYGFVDTKGDVIIDYMYSEATPFGQKYGYSIVKRENTEYMLDTSKVEYPLTRNLQKLKTDSTITALIATLRYKSDRLIIQNSKQLKVLFVEPNARDINQVLLRRLLAGLSEVPDLETLGLSKTGLENIPKEIFELKKLLTLDLSDNKLSETLTLFPVDMAEQKTLKKLDLSGNGLKSLPENVRMFTGLKYLNLQRNPIGPKEQKEIRKMLPKCEILFKDYFAEPQQIMAEIRKLQRTQVDSNIQLYKNLVAVLENHHQELPLDYGIKTSLYRAKSTLAWWKTRKTMKASTHADSLAYYQTTLKDTLLVYARLLPADQTINTQLAQAYGNMANYLLLMQRFPEAEKAATSGIEIDPAQTFIKLNLAHALLWQGKYAAAEKNYREYLVNDNACLTTLIDFADYKKSGLSMHADVPKIEALISALNF